MRKRITHMFSFFRLIKQKKKKPEINMYISEYFPYPPTFGLLPFWDLNKTQGFCHKRLDFRFANVVPVTFHKSLQFFINVIQRLSLCNILVIVSILIHPFPPKIKFYRARANCSKNLGANIKAPFTHLKETTKYYFTFWQKSSC